MIPLEVASDEALIEPTTCSSVTGLAVPMPTFPAPSITNGVVSEATSLTRKARLFVPVALCWISSVVLVLAVSLFVRASNTPVLAALEPESVTSSRLPVNAVADEDM